MSPATRPATSPATRPAASPVTINVTRLLAGAITGLVAAIAGLGVAELVAAASPSFQSPVLDVADRVVDGVPNWLKDAAISWFGTNDKIALLVGIATILTVAAAGAGIIVLGTRRWLTRLALGLVGVVGIVGAYASQSTRRDAALVAVLPSLVGTAVSLVVLVELGRRWRQSTTSPTSTSGSSIASGVSIAEQVPNDRRRFLIGAGATAFAGVATGLTGRAVSRDRGASASRAALSLPVADRPLAAATSGVSVPVAGVSPFITPNSDFYRIDTAITVPQLAAEDWTLRIRGLVDRPLELTYDELLRREIVEADITLTCVSNEVGGNLLGTARWLGVRLDDLLDDVGVDATADQVVGRSVDGYTCGFPLAALDGRDALVAIGMNGEPLPLRHGFPARLIVPGLYGYVSATKWLTELELTRFDAFDQYWVERGWVDDAPIRLQSRIDTPRGLSTPGGGRIAVAGVAWAPTRGIDRVELQIDDGEWVVVRLAAELNQDTWRQWWHEWDAAPGRHTLRVRAVDRTGEVQTDERATPFPSGATGLHQIVVIVR